MVSTGSIVGGFSTNQLLNMRFASQVIGGRWFMVFACLLIMSASGSSYIFGIYSKDIKSVLGYNQQTLNTLSFFKDVGTNVGILAGFINEVSPPWVVLLSGSFVNLAGYLMIYLAITGRTSAPPVWLMCIYIFIGANALSFSNTGALVTCVKNFPESRGNVIGLLKGFVGLSGAIFTQLYLAIYGDDSKSLVLLIAWLPGAVSIVFVYTIRIIPYASSQGKKMKPFFYFLYISIVLAVFLLLMIVVQQVVSFPRFAFAISAAVIVLILFLPLVVVIKEEIKILIERNQSLQNPPTIIIEEPKPAPASVSQSSSSWYTNVFRPPAYGNDYSILQALLSPEMFILFFATVCGLGGTLTAIDNMGQIGQSLGYPKKSINTFVSLISIWNYAGRVTAGFASEMVLSKYKFPRPLALTLVILFSCVGHLLIAFGVTQSLYVASIIIGFCFGAQWPLLYTIISELFGLKYYSTLFNFGSVASPIGVYILNIRVAGHLYDMEARKQSGGSDKICIGVQCFKMSFIIITAVTVLGAFVSLILFWRTKEFYRSDIYAKFRVSPAAVEGGSSAEIAMEDTGLGKMEMNGEIEQEHENTTYSKKRNIRDARC